MRLNIRFGLDLDGYRPAAADDCHGQVSLGPLGMLSQLETRLGLSVQQPASMRRLTGYLQLLRQCDNGSRFYSASLQVDPLALAHSLLDWRDRWIEAGWNGTADADSAPRLRDLAEVEQALRQSGQVPPGPADRLAAIAERLEMTSLSLDIVLVDPLTEFPQLWQRVLQQLGAREELPEKNFCLARPDSDLGRLQRALRDGSSFTPAQDGSLLLLTAPDEGLLARALSRIQRGDLPAASCCAEALATQVVSEQSLSAIDQTLWLEDGPLTGASDTSAWRPPLQVLPLALSLFWQPLDPRRLLEFLAHPICPVPAPARYRLADVVAQAPGLGGVAWRKAISELEENLQQQTENKQAATAAIKNLRQRLADWLELPRFDPATGAPPQRLAEHCAHLARWMSQRAQLENVSPGLRTLLLAAASQAREAQQGLDDLALGQSYITKVQLDRLLEEVTTAGTPVPENRAELGAIPSLRAPGAAIANQQRLLWWNFIEPWLPQRLPWSHQELTDLVRQGARLQSPRQQYESLLRRWQRPILAASDQLVLLRPLRQRGEEVRLHPLGNLLQSLCGDRQISTIDLSAELAENEISTTTPLRLHLQLEPQTPRPLPGLRRWWQLDQPQWLTRRETESFSSLQALLFSPYQWVLNYKARLRTSSLNDLATGSRLKGNLFHHLIEALLTDRQFDWLQATDQQIGQATRQCFERLLAEEAATFLQPGQRREKQSLADTATRSVCQLILQLRAAQVRHVEIEKPVQGRFSGGDLAGAIDLLVTNADGDEAVIDLKWGGSRYRATELRTNRALQLALYAWLRRQQQRWPAQAFFILEEGCLLAHNTHYFPLARVCPPLEDNATIAGLWQQFEAAYQWRRAQLDAGQIEVTVTGTLPDEQSQAPEYALTIPETSDRFNDYACLTGWEEQA
ncbi:MAG: PD-(D/E)XK nuclease family protein [Desulfuromonas thiophila]|nr:PD-(D/E)XK nuclease family protein [Desulfuromonas thiophila]